MLDENDSSEPAQIVEKSDPIPTVSNSIPVSSEPLPAMMPSAEQLQKIDDEHNKKHAPLMKRTKGRRLKGFRKILKVDMIPTMIKVEKYNVYLDPSTGALYNIDSKRLITLKSGKYHIYKRDAKKHIKITEEELKKEINNLKSTKE